MDKVYIVLNLSNGDLKVFSTNELAEEYRSELDGWFVIEEHEVIKPS